MSDREYEPRLRDPRIPVAAEASSEEARGEVVSPICFINCFVEKMLMRATAAMFRLRAV